MQVTVHGLSWRIIVGCVNGFNGSNLEEHSTMPIKFLVIFIRDQTFKVVDHYGLGIPA
jgi:hypothetical protein